MFSQACVKNSVQMGVSDIHPPADTPLPWQTPLGRHPPRQILHPSPPQTATAADGIHPTGCILSNFFYRNLRGQDQDLERERDREWEQRPMGSLPISPFLVLFPFSFPFPCCVKKPLAGEGVGYAHDLYPLKCTDGNDIFQSFLFPVLHPLNAGNK